jgi:hypothetical protein
VFNNERQQKLVQPLFAAVGPEKLNELIGKYRSLLFPESKYDEFRYMKKSKTVFERMRGYEFHIKPT